MILYNKRKNPDEKNVYFLNESGHLREVASERLGVREKQRVDEAEELHDALVLTQVLVTFQKELVLLAVTPCKVQTC